MHIRITKCATVHHVGVKSAIIDAVGPYLQLAEGRPETHCLAVMYTPQADLSEDGKSLTAIIDELRVLCKCREKNGNLSSSELARTRKIWPRLRSLLIHGHPLRGLECTPPERTVQDPRLDLLSQPIQDAMDGLMTYANMYRTLCAIKVCPKSIFKALEPLEKKGWDW